MKIQTTVENLDNYKIYLQVEKAVHEFMEKHNYLKVDLPVLSPFLIPESYLEIFETEFNYFNKKEKLYLTPSPELFLKRLLVGGIGNCYYLGRAYRNCEPNSDWHSPEFTMLEFYKVGINYLEMAEEVLKMLQFVNKKCRGNDTMLFDRWEKYSVSEAFEKFSGIKKEKLFNEKLFFKKAKDKGYNVNKTTYEDIFSQILATEIEPKLGVNGYPTLLYDYPKQMASLAKLNDYKEQQKRFISEAKKRKKNKIINHSIDKGFIEALKYGLPNCTGAGIGFERLVMIFANTTSINQLKLINIV